MRVLIALVCWLCAVAPSLAAPARPRPVVLERSLVVEGQVRRFTVMAPDNRSGALPVLIVYHGGGQTAERARRYTRFDEWVVAEGFVAVYPHGLNNNWNDGRQSDDLAARAASEVDDVAFTEQLIDVLVAEGLADGRRVFLTGASNGGMMAMRAACALGPKVAGIAPVVANMPVDWKCKAAAMPALLIHGTDDDFMPYAGGQVAAGKTRRDLGAVLSADETVAVFEKINGCTGVKETKTLDEIGRDKTAVVIVAYECARGALTHIEVQGGGHTWPGAKTSVLADWLLGGTTEEVNATAEIWNFFKGLPER